MEAKALRSSLNQWKFGLQQRHFDRERSGKPSHRGRYYAFRTLSRRRRLHMLKPIALYQDLGPTRFHNRDRARRLVNRLGFAVQITSIAA